MTMKTFSDLRFSAFSFLLACGLSIVCNCGFAQSAPASDGPKAELGKDERALEKPAEQSSKHTPQDEEQLKKANRLHGEVTTLLLLDRFDEALPLAEEELTIRKTILGENHRDCLASLDALASIYESRDEYEKAERIGRHALEISANVWGKDHRNYATNLNNLAKIYKSMGEYAKAEPLMRQATEIREKVLGKNHCGYADSLDDLANIYRAMGEYAKAEPLVRQTLEIREKIYGTNHRDYALSLSSLALLYDSMGEYAKAEPLYRRSLEINEKVLGKNHPDYAANLLNLAGLYKSMDEFAKAEPLYHEALETIKKNSGEMDPDYASSLNNLAGFYQSKGEYGKAEPLYRRALEIRKKVRGEAHPDYAESLNNLAVFYYSIGEYTKAEPPCRKALQIELMKLGKEHPTYAIGLNNLAVIYDALGEYELAEPLSQRALEIRKKVYGPMNPIYATGLDNLAALYHEMGEYAKAEPLCLQALEIRKNVFGTKHSHYATSLNNLAMLYDSMGEYEKAEQRFQETLLAQKENLGEMHPEYASTLCNLAGLYLKMGPCGKAEPLLRQALDIRKQTVGEASNDYADTLNALGAFYRSTHEFEKAEPLFHRALEITKLELGETHPDYAMVVNNLAMNFESKGDREQAEPLYRQALKAKLLLLNRVLPSLPEAQAINFVRRQHVCPEFVLSVSRKLPGDHADDAFQAAWKTRALVARTLAQRRQLVADSPDAKGLLIDLRAAQQELAQLTLATVQPQNSAARKSRLRELNDRKEELESQLAKVSESFRRVQQLQDVTAQDLMRRVPNDAAVVQFVAPCHLNPPDDNPEKCQPDANYDAFILRRSDTPQGYSVAWVDLGAAKPISDAITDWRANFKERAAPKSSSSAPPERVLRQRLWDPLEPHLTGCSTVYLLPDGDLNFIPWAALPGRQPNTCLLEDYALATASHGQQLCAAFAETERLSERVLLVGGVNYQDSPTGRPTEKSTLLAAESPAESELRRSAAMEQRLVWAPLPGTAAETAAIEKLRDAASRPVVLQGPEADEETLRRLMPQCGYIHFATHGFFADEPFRSVARHDTAGEELYSRSVNSMMVSRGSVTARNPLILSGVVLAGANRPPETNSLGLPTGDDGIMTAEEVVGLNLRGTRLVVLSACDTGLGRVSGGEGVMGLVRAFQLAGARNVVASLWKVDDRMTAALMQLFYYKLWKENKRPIDALREAQLAIYRHPEQIPQLGETRGPTFEKTVELADGGKKSPAARTIPPVQWAAFMISGPGN
jgi:tetratricopeptide (TPR) repeat protein/CHAT domain-containing protein